jgi:hypothetical protein
MDSLSLRIDILWLVRPGARHRPPGTYATGRPVRGDAGDHGEPGRVPSAPGRDVWPFEANGLGHAEVTLEIARACRISTENRSTAVQHLQANAPLLEPAEVSDHRAGDASFGIEG